MKAHVSPSGSVVLWSGALPSSFDGWFVDVTEDAPPPITDQIAVEPGPLVVDYTDSVPTQVRRTWTTRPKTRDERVPAEIATWRFRSAIKLTGKYDAVLIVLAALEEPTKTVAFEQFEYSNTTERDHPLIEALGAQVGLNRDQLDDLFVLGASLA